MQPIEQVDLDRVVGIVSRFFPEIILCFVVVALIVCVLFKRLQGWSFYITIAGILINLLVLAPYFLVFDYVPRIMGENFVVVIRFIAGIAALLIVIISGRRQRVEYYLFLISMLIGANILAMSYDFLLILLSMELLSLSSYVITAGMEADKRRAEAAWKFFIFGSAATAVMIFGMTYIYGGTGSFSFPTSDQNNQLVTIGAFMVLAGFLFKMTAAPFHLWAPDVYEATPTPIIAFLSVVPKLAGFVVVMRLVKGLGTEWTIVIAAVSIFTIIVGTLAALNQTNAKRMMAYSSVAQAGFLLAIPAGGSLESIAFYFAAVLLVMNFAVFIVIHENEKANLGTAFIDFTGAGYRNPFAAVGITLGLVSLTGIPPVAGFMAKLFVFQGVWTQYSDTGNIVFIALFVVGLLATVASLFFYLKIPFYMFFRRDEERPAIKIGLTSNLLLLILVGLLLTLFLMPGLLMGW